MIPRERRWSRTNPCPICGGHPNLPQGKGLRCYGYLSSDGAYAYCTRPEYAGDLERHPGSNAFPHRLEDAPPPEPPPKVVPMKRHVVATYPYRDEKGNVLFESVRYEPKSFSQRRRVGNEWINNLEGVRIVLYHLPEIIRSSPDQPIYVCEGEKDCDLMARLGFVATTNPMGARKWHLLEPKIVEHFRGRDAILIPDNDEIGRQHMDEVASSLYSIARTIKVLELPGLPLKGDVFDWIQAEAEKHRANGMTEEDWIKNAIAETLDELATVSYTHLTLPTILRV